MFWVQRRSSGLVTLDLSGVPIRGPRPVGHVETPTEIIIPTDLMFAAWRSLFPAERMMVFAGRGTARGFRITSASDVTESTPSAAHVRACAEKMTRTLVDFERTGVHLAVWVHSHPGGGLRATFPSSIDLKQYADLQCHYSERLIGIIVVRDGYLRVWGSGIIRGRVKVRWLGTGIQHDGERDVYRLKIS